MAEGKSASSKPRKRSTSRSTNGSSATKAKSRRTSASSASGGARGARESAEPAQDDQGLVAKVKGPAIAVGATAAGIAGGVLLRNRMGRRQVLGMSLPRSLNGQLRDVDMRSLAKSVGHASQRFAKTSKSLSRDLERAGDQAERIGRILG